MGKVIFSGVLDFLFQKLEATKGNNRGLDVPSCLTTNHYGECYCGDIRFQINREPVILLYCFCNDCLPITGEDGYHSSYLVKESNFQLIRGTPTTHEELSKEGRTIKRYYCHKCGANIWAQTDLDLLSVWAGTCDDTSVFRSVKEVFLQTAPEWARDPNTRPI